MLHHCVKVIIGNNTPTKRGRRNNKDGEYIAFSIVYLFSLHLPFFHVCYIIAKKRPLSQLILPTLSTEPEKNEQHNILIYICLTSRAHRVSGHVLVWPPVPWPRDLPHQMATLIDTRATKRFHSHPKNLLFSIPLCSEYALCSLSRYTHASVDILLISIHQMKLVTVGTAR